MAKATHIEDAPTGSTRWDVADEPPYITLVLDRNEALAVRNATRPFHTVAVEKNSHPTSLNGAAARVYVAMKASIGIEVV